MKRCHNWRGISAIGTWRSGHWMKDTAGGFMVKAGVEKRTVTKAHVTGTAVRRPIIGVSLTTRIGMTVTLVHPSSESACLGRVHRLLQLYTDRWCSPEALGGP